MSHSVRTSVGIMGTLVLVVAMFASPIRSMQHVTAAVTGTWTTVAPLPGPRTRPAAAVGANGNIYVFGGNFNGVDYNTTFIYHPSSNSWTQGANMPTAREGAQAVSLPGGRIAVLGGGQNCASQNSSCVVFSTVEIYTPNTNTWGPAAPMLTPRYRFAATGSNGHIYAIGGWNNGQALSSAETYNAATNSWSYLDSLPQAEEAPAASIANGTLTVVGGWDGQTTATYYNNVWIYTVRTGWSSGAAMPTAREDLGATTGPDGQIYALGGYNTNMYLTTVEAYNASANSWSSITPMPAVTCCMAALTGVTGLMYAIGGAGNPSAGTQVDVLNIVPGPPTATPTPTLTPVPTPTATSTPGPIVVNVPATQPWTDTGIDVTAGETISVTASGTISIIPGSSNSPAGQAGCIASENSVAPGLTCYNLVARIGNGVPFAVGTGISWQAATSGRLGLGINDSIFSDNSGSFTAAITVK